MKLPGTTFLLAAAVTVSAASLPGSGHASDILPAAPAAPSAYTLTAPFEMVYHWNRLDWNFNDPAMKQEFESKQYWKTAIPAGVKVDSQGRYYVSVPRWYPGIPASMNRIVMKEGKPLLEPFPSWEMNRAGDPDKLQSVLGYEIDEQNRIWMLDQGHIASQPSQPGSQKLVVWDLTENRLIDSVPIPEHIASYTTSFLNDLVVDNRNGFVYITDSGNGSKDSPVAAGLVVYDMKAKSFRRVLHQHFSTQDFPGFRFSIMGKPVFQDRPMKTGADGIALSADRRTLYYSPLSARNLYAIDTALLRDFDTPMEKIEQSVTALGSKGTNTDGMHADNQGNVWYTMLEDQGIGRYSREGKFQPFVSDDRMLWVDGVAFDQKGSLIFNSNRLHELRGTQETVDWTHPYNLVIWKAYAGPGVKSYLYAE
ncbi:sugar lactone lactonase YvrE [Paenibacillus mucilaginosus]|uniref:L-dopachrome tautomerase-related protein n=1 Tax=Paenibacillus mucilaginosus TaxID=61624 RepID=UPI003D20F3F6